MPQLAPSHVARFKELVEEGFYDNLIFHRVIPHFMVQTGCPNGNGRGGTEIKLDDEIAGGTHLIRGMLYMANAGPNTADSQFFITKVDCSWFDKKHTIFGRVINGMELVDEINGGGTYGGWAPYGYSPDIIISMKLLKDTNISPESIIDEGPTEEQYLHSLDNNSQSLFSSWFDW